MKTKLNIFNNMLGYGDYLTKLANLNVSRKSPDEIKNIVSGELNRFIEEGLGVGSTGYLNGIGRIKTNIFLNMGDSGSDNSIQPVHSGMAELIIENNKEINDVARIPFFIKGEEILPFDIIEFGTQKFVFTPANFIRILEAMKKIAKDPGVIETDVSYDGVEDHYSPISDVGHMQELMNIRQNQLNFDDSTISAVAGQIDDFMDKVAEIKPLHKNFVKAIEVEAEKVAYDASRTAFEKIAGDTTDVSDRILQSSDIFKKLKGLPWKNLKALKTGEKIQIVDAETGGGELKLKNAICFAGRNVPVSKYVKDKREMVIDTYSDRIVVDEDGGYKVLRAGTDMYEEYKVVASNPDFKLKARNFDEAILDLDEVKETQYLIIMGNEHYGPLKLGRIKSEWVHGYGANQPMNSAFNTLNQVLFTLDGGDQANEHSWGGKPLLIMDGTGSKKLEHMSYPEVRQYLENICSSPSEVANIIGNLSAEGGAFKVPKDAKVIELKHFISTPVKSLQDIVFDGNDLDLTKVAAGEEVILRKPVPDQDNYSMIFKRGVFDQKKFDNLVKEDVIAIARNTKVSENEIIAMLAFLDSGEKEIARSLTFDLSGIDGTEVKNKKDGLVTKIIDKYLTPFDAGSIARGVGTDAATEVVADYGSKMMGSVAQPAFSAIKGLFSLASDAAALSERFEKIAIEKESEDFKALAHLMVLTNKIDNAMIKMASAQDKELFDVKPLLREVPQMVSGLIEKAAAEVYDMAVTQRNLDEELIAQNTLTQTLRTLDRLSKYASHFAKL